MQLQLKTKNEKRDVLVNVKFTKSEFAFIKVLSHRYTKGNLSELVRKGIDNLHKGASIADSN